MAYPELQGLEIEINPVMSDTLVTYWQYWVSLDGEQRSPKLRGTYHQRIGRGRRTDEQQAKERDVQNRESGRGPGVRAGKEGGMVAATVDQRQYQPGKVALLAKCDERWLDWRCRSNSRPAVACGRNSVGRVLASQAPGKPRQLRS